MTRLSVIIPVFNGEEHIAKTLDSMVSQSVEDFEVIIIDDGSTDATEKICREYCEKYVDFFCYKQEHGGVYAARNNGIDKSKGEYIVFLDCGDVITDESIEAVFENDEKNHADIVTGRCWRFGDIEYEYDSKLDILAVMPEVEKLESSLLWCSELGCRAFKKKLLDVNKIRFYDVTAYGELLFLMQCVMAAGKISGCPEFVLEKRTEPVTSGWTQFEMPTYENLKSASFVISEIYKMGKAEIIRQTGEVQGDEAYCQEILYMAYTFYINNFYRRYWYMDEKSLKLLKDEFDKFAVSVEPTRFQKLKKTNEDMRLPIIYTDKKGAATEPVFSIIFDIAKPEDYKPFLRSLYAQDYPFFEILVNESHFEMFPEEFKKMENIQVFGDRHFHSEARRDANSKNCIEIRNGKPLDRRVLKEVCMSKIPAFIVQYAFDSKRKSYETRKTLKDKGLAMPDK